MRWGLMLWISLLQFISSLGCFFPVALLMCGLHSAELVSSFSSGCKEVFLTMCTFATRILNDISSGFLSYMKSRGEKNALTKVSFNFAGTWLPWSSV